eukprot:CAMPEP_0197436130 /NCGR_PEP_ID=MMETSP1175-20131217/3606_1 /TAXON_ID=1003142 /ORGANISM="Triceratium dubium, Strain CCMP147" /LENGTH=372 /DNA_ID=CAMNT_0042965341 /DNA_START=741 /DNA_END=1859 /DNA_ORIENTATION=+
MASVAPPQAHNQNRASAPTSGELLPTTIATDEDSAASEGYDSLATPRSNFSRPSRRPERPLSPATPAEHFFLTDQFFLSDNIGLSGFPSSSAGSQRSGSRKPLSSKNSIASGVSASTEDFQSACGDSLVGDSFHDAHLDETGDKLGSSDFFGKDILVVSRQQIVIPEEREEDLNQARGHPNMAKKKTTQSAVAPKTTTKTETVAAAPVAKTAPPKMSEPVKASESEAHFDVAQHAYSAAKNIWSFGRSIPVGGAILGLYEAAAGKVLDIIVHKDLPGVDSEIKPHLVTLDKDIIDPAVLAIVKFFTPAVEKGGEVVGPVVSPIVATVLKIFPKQIEAEKQNEATAKQKEAEKEATMPELSTPVAAPTAIGVN